VGGIVGAIYTFKCKKCSYDVESSGDFDFGMHAVVRPYICNDCNIVTDALVGQQGVEYPKEQIENPEGNDIPELVLLDKDEYYTCEKCNGKNLTVWNPKWRKCPKCGHRMIKGSEIALWD
jgi:DNA-directed RNA polymerase subunit RPC12/RpoP